MIQPDEFEYLFTGKSTDSNIAGNTSDSGHEIFVSTADAPDANAVIRASQFDSAIVCTVNDTASDGSATHVTTEDLTQAQVYGWVKHRWINLGGASTKDNNLGLVIGFSDLNPGTTDSGAHIVINQEHTLVQTYSNGSADNMADHEYDDPGTAWCETEVALNRETGQAVIRTLDGVVQSFYSDALVSSVVGIHPDFEFFMQSPDTGWRIEYQHFKSSSLEAMDEERLAYYNDLLEQGGADPIGPTDPPGDIDYVDSTFAEATPIDVVTLASHASGDLLLMMGANMTGTTSVTAPAGWITPANGTAVNSICAGRVASKRAASGAETSGDWETGGEPEVLINANYRGFEGGVGAVAVATGNSGTIAFPALTLEKTDGTSWVACVAVYENDTGTMGSGPAGTTTRESVDTSDYVAGWYDTDGGVSSWAGGNISAGGSDRWIAWSIELKVEGVTFGHISSGNTLNSQTQTLGEHKASDVIIQAAGNMTGTDLPVAPAGWVVPANSSAANSICATRVVHKTAASAAETSGTWGAGAGLEVLMNSVYRGFNSGVGAVAVATGNSGTIGFPALTLQKTDGTSWVVCVAVYENDTGTVTTPPSGMTVRNTVDTADYVAGWYDTNAGVSSFAGKTLSAGGSDRWIAYSIELLDAPLAITFIGATSAEGNPPTMTLPTHQAGDLLVRFLFNDDGGSVPLKPSDWTSHITRSTASSAMRIIYKIATSSSESVGTCADANQEIVHCYRNASGLGAIATATGDVGSIPYPALTLQNTTGTSWVACFAGHIMTDGAIGTAPSGMTNRVNLAGSTGDAGSHDTNGPVSSWSGGSVAYGGTVDSHKCCSVEILN